MRGMTPERYPEFIFHEDGRLRVRIEPMQGVPIKVGDVEAVAADPPQAQAHMYQEGWCEYDAPCEALGGAGNPKITLDDGTVIWGYQCWWHPVEKGTVQ